MANGTEMDEDLAGYPAPGAPPAPANVTGTTPWSVIGQAADQLNAGQPVTALPHQSWSPAEAQAFSARLDAFDQQAKAAVIARDQAARDARMLDQLARVAHSTKDIAVAMQQQDEIGFRNAVAGGMPSLQALQQFPRAASAPLVAAARASQTPAATTWVPPTAGTPGYVLDPRGNPHFPPGTGQGPAHALGSVVPVNDPTTGVSLGNVITTGPNTGRFEKAATGELTGSQQVAVQRARITAINAQLANAYTIKDAKERDRFISDKSAELNDISKTLTDMPKVRVALPPSAAGGTNAVVRKAFKNPDTGKWELK